MLVRRTGINPQDGHKRLKPMPIQVAYPHPKARSICHSPSRVRIVQQAVGQRFKFLNAAEKGYLAIGKVQNQFRSIIESGLRHTHCRDLVGPRGGSRGNNIKKSIVTGAQMR